MALTNLKDRYALILGVDSAPGRSAAQQLSRAGCKVLLASRDEERTLALADQLTKKGGEPLPVILPEETGDWAELLQMALGHVGGHFHLVANALALCYGEETAEERARAKVEARLADETLAKALHGGGPLKMLTFWPESADDGEPYQQRDLWHGVIELGDYQRLDSEAAGPKQLKAGALGDTVVFLLQLPPSACPMRLRLEHVPSSEKRPAESE